MVLIKKINYDEKHFRKRTSKQKNDYLKAQEKLLKQYTLNNILKIINYKKNFGKRRLKSIKSIINCNNYWLITASKITVFLQF